MNTQYASAFTSTPEKLVRDTFFSINDTYQEARKAYDEWTQTSLTVERECPTDKRGYYDQTHPTYQAHEQATQRLNDAKRRHQQACVNTVNNAIQQGDAQTLWLAIMHSLSYSFILPNGDTNTSTLIDRANWEAMVLMGTVSTTVTRSAAQHPHYRTARYTARAQHSTASPSNSAKKAKSSQ